MWGRGQSRTHIHPIYRRVSTKHGPLWPGTDHPQIARKGHFPLTRPRKPTLRSVGDRHSGDRHPRLGHRRTGLPRQRLPTRGNVPPGAPKRRHARPRTGHHRRCKAQGMLGALKGRNPPRIPAPLVPRSREMGFELPPRSPNPPAVACSPAQHRRGFDSSHRPPKDR